MDKVFPKKKNRFHASSRRKMNRDYLELSDIHR